jgi:hypothetical protein
MIGESIHRPTSSPPLQMLGKLVFCGMCMYTCVATTTCCLFIIHHICRGCDPNAFWKRWTDSTSSCPHGWTNLKRWEDPNTWGGWVPSTWQDVTLPENSRVFITTCSFPKTEPFNSITIPATSEVCKLLDEPDTFSLYALPSTRNF